jgi:hypothetical protein
MRNSLKNTEYSKNTREGLHGRRRSRLRCHQPNVVRNYREKLEYIERVHPVFEMIRTEYESNQKLF